MGLLLKTLGGFELRGSDGTELSLPTRKARALLSYLAVHADNPQPRERLMALLWSDRGERQARQSLNHALVAVRRLGEYEGVKLLESDSERVTLRGEGLGADVERMRTLAADNPADAAELYTGPFLEGLSIPDRRFEEWVRAARAEFHELACTALEAASTSANDPKTSIEYVRRLIALDPMREEAHRRLMHLLHRSGDRAGALLQYRTFADILKRELDVQPDAATRALFKEIRDGAQTDASVDGPSEIPKSLPPLEKPSIAVLPFDNLGGDSAQDVLGDGIAEDIITELSRFHSIFVISRGSSFSFKGQLLETRTIAGKLGVQYILEGSVRTHGSRIRITAQLIDAEHDLHLWSERYDREIADIFELQDEITRNIVGIIEPAIGYRERERARIREPLQLDAWVLLQRGLSRYYLSTRQSLEDAVRYFEETIALNKRMAAAHALRADSLVRIFWHNGPEGQMQSLASARGSAERGIILDSQDARCPLALARVHLFLGNGADASKSIGRSLELNPNLAMAYYARGWILSAFNPSARVYTDCLRDIDYAIRLSPNDPFLAGFFGFRSRILLQNQQYEEAADNARTACQSPNPRPLAFALLAAALTQLGRDEESDVALAELKQRAPRFNLGFVRSIAKTWTLDRRNLMEELFRAARIPD